MEMFYIATVVMAAQLCTLVTIHQLILLKYIPFLVYELYLNDVTKRQKEGPGLSASFAILSLGQVIPLL